MNRHASTGARRMRSLNELMGQALTMEREAVARYTELADMMETHNNLDVAALFRKMAGYEQLHVAQILADMGWADAMVVPRQSGGGARANRREVVPIGRDALPDAALARAAAGALGRAAGRGLLSPSWRHRRHRSGAQAAEEMAEEGRPSTWRWCAREWLAGATVPQPDGDWSVDPDPPRYID